MAGRTCTKVDDTTMFTVGIMSRWFWEDPGTWTWEFVVVSSKICTQTFEPFLVEQTTLEACYQGRVAPLSTSIRVRLPLMVY